MVVLWTNWVCLFFFPFDALKVKLIAAVLAAVGGDTVINKTVALGAVGSYTLTHTHTSAMPRPLTLPAGPGGAPLRSAEPAGPLTAEPR